jgi:hypothetical protein
MAKGRLRLALAERGKIHVVGQCLYAANGLIREICRGDLEHRDGSVTHPVEDIILVGVRRMAAVRGSGDDTAGLGCLPGIGVVHDIAVRRNIS